MRFCFRAVFATLFLVFFALPLGAQSIADTSASDSSVATDSSESFDWENEENLDSSREQNRSQSSIMTFVKMLVALVVVVGCVYAVFVFLKKNAAGGAQSNDPFLRQVAHLSLGAGKSVRVVSLVGKAYIVGVTENSINLLAEVDDKELVDSMNLYADKNDRSVRPRSFSDILEMFMPSKNGNVFSSNAQSAAVSLQKQRERFDSRNNSQSEEV